MLECKLNWRNISRSILSLVTLLVIFGSLESVEASSYYSLIKEPRTTVTSPPVELQEGTAGISTIYTNSTSARVNVAANTSFGYETTGGSSQKVVDRITGSWFTCPGSGVAQSITAYMSKAAGGGVVKCAIYKRSDNSLVGNTTERNDIGTAGWYTFNFTSPKPSLQNIDYYLVVWAYSAGTYLNYDVETGKGAYQDLTYGAFPDPWSPTSEDRKYSIYLTYTYDYVLKIVNSVTDDWKVNLKVYDSSNVTRLSNTTISFHDGSTSDQIIVTDGNITQSEGQLYDFAGNTTIYISMSNIQASSSGTSYIYVYLEIRIPNTTTYTRYIITFEIT